MKSTMKLILTAAILVAIIVTIRSKNNKPIMYGRASCLYTVKMINELKEHNVFKKFEYVDTETKAGKQSFMKEGGEGVPCFVYNGRVVTGYMPARTLLKKLKIV